MKKTFHKADSRGYADHGWLRSNHTFSFASYFNSERMNFGCLRVLNDDIIQPGKGFDTHSHNNMEIISIPVYGEITHKDSTGSEEVLRTGEIQLMSAGSGLTHSEYNKSNKELNFLQIWIYPKVKNIQPNYQQKSFETDSNKNQLILAVSPENSDSLKINQDAYISIGNFDSYKKIEYKLNNSSNGVYIFLINGQCVVDGTTLNNRDAVGIYETDSIEIDTIQDSYILLIEIPMEVNRNG